MLALQSSSVRGSLHLFSHAYRAPTDLQVAGLSSCQLHGACSSTIPAGCSRLAEPAAASNPRHCHHIQVSTEIFHA